MKLPKGCTVAVADGEKLALFQNAGEEAEPKLTSVPHTHVDDDHSGAGSHQHSNAANPDDGAFDKATFAVGVAQLLNKRVAGGKISKLIIIAAPQTLGEMRKHYDKALTARLLGEIPKDLTGSSTHDIEKTIAGA